MVIIAASPFGALLTLFGAVPLLIIAGIYGAEGASALFHHRDRSKRP